MLERPSRLRFTTLKSELAMSPRMYSVRPIKYFVAYCMVMLIPYASVRTYNRIDRTGYWDRRIEEKRVRKMAFDFMLKS